MATEGNTTSNDVSFVRNFRSAYYEKVGFCGIEEEKVLDAILTSSPLDIEKLSDFCSRFDLARRREEAWKLLLGVQCNSKNPFDCEGKIVTKIRAEHFELLKRHVEHLLCHNEVIRKRLIYLCSSHKISQTPIPQQTPTKTSQHMKTGNCSNNSETQEFFYPPSSESNSKNEQDEDTGSGDENKVPTFMHPLSNAQISKTPHLLTLNGSLSSYTISAWSQENKGRHVTLMYLLETGRLNSKGIDTLDPTECRIMSNMASIFVNISSDLQAAFFMFKRFLKKLERNRELLDSQFKQNLTELVRDMPELDKHIRSVCSFDDLPCWYWFRFCFIDILDEKATLRLWDKIISGCLKCLTKVFKVIFSELEPVIMSSNSLDSIKRLLTDRDKFCLREFPQNSQV